jgi:hypothetical protein
LARRRSRARAGFTITQTLWIQVYGQQSQMPHIS